MMALFLLCSVTTTVSVLKLPPTYTTSATLLVQEAQIPENMLNTVLQVDTDQQLQIIQERLLTRANLLDIARKQRVFQDMSNMTADEIVRNMQGQTKLRRTGGRNEAKLMSVVFEARTPQVAANVVNEYVTLILQESTEFRVNRTEGTLDFFEQEVDRLSDDLDQQSVKIVNFKNANGDALPDDLSYRQNRQTLLQERQARLEREIAAMEKQRRDMVAIFESSGQVNPSQERLLTPQEQQLRGLQIELQEALSIFSESNPRVILLRGRIEKLEIAIAEQSVPTTAQESESSTAQTPSMFELTLTEMNQRKVSLQQELLDVEVELDELAASIQATAGNAIVLNALERDYQNLQTRYSEAVANKNQALVSERIEVSAKGERITVLENANVPQSPSGPNRFALISMGVGAGSGLAIGFFVLLELLNRVIRRPMELEARFGIIPLAVIPYMESRRERLIRRSVLVCAFLAALIGVPMVLWYIDTAYMPLNLLANKVFDRLGLI